jgi:hypothetical protein
MMLFAILCVSMFTLSHMSVTYDLHFEQRSILQHATMSFANALAVKVSDWASPASHRYPISVWWKDNGWEEAKGSLTVDKSTFRPIHSDTYGSSAGSTYSGPPMRFSFHIYPSKIIDKDGFVRLSVKGEFLDPTVTTKNMAWFVSLDVTKDRSPKEMEWQDIAFGSPDAKLIWAREK